MLSLRLVLPIVIPCWLTHLRLQRVLNAAAQVITGIRIFYHGLSHLLHSKLHWLDIQQRVQY